jgi:hypothetical protein
MKLLLPVLSLLASTAFAQSPDRYADMSQPPEWGYVGGVRSVPADTFAGYQVEDSVPAHSDYQGPYVYVPHGIEYPVRHFDKVVDDGSYAILPRSQTAADTYVHGYYRRSGVYVRGYYRR